MICEALQWFYWNIPFPVGMLIFGGLLLALPISMMMMAIHQHIWKTSPVRTLFASIATSVGFLPISAEDSGPWGALFSVLIYLAVLFCCISEQRDKGQKNGKSRIALSVIGLLCPVIVVVASLSFYDQFLTNLIT